MPKRKRGDPDRPHICDHSSNDGSSLNGDNNAKVFRFSSHGGLVFHLVREHLIRASIVSKCDEDCPMLDMEHAVAGS